MLIKDLIYTKRHFNLLLIYEICKNYHQLEKITINYWFVTRVLHTSVYDFKNFGKKQYLANSRELLYDNFLVYKFWEPAKENSAYNRIPWKPFLAYMQYIQRQSNTCIYNIILKIENDGFKNRINISRIWSA